MSVLSQTMMRTGGTRSWPGVAAWISVYRSSHCAGDLLEGALGLAIHHLRLRLAGLPRQLLARLESLPDRLPQLEVLRVGPPGGVQNRQARDLHDPALDGIHQAEVADEPRERPPLGIAAALDVERRGRQVHAHGDARHPLAIDAGVVQPIQRVNPDGRLLRLVLQRPPLLGRELLPLRHGRGPPAMVPLVVQHQDRHPVVEVAEHPPGERVRRLRPLVHHRVGPIPLLVLRLRSEPVPVRDEHLAGLHQRAVLHRDQIERRVIVLRILRPQDLETLLHGQVGAADQDGVRILRAQRVLAAIAEGPGDQHGHHDGLPGPGGHLAAEPPQRKQIAIDRADGSVHQRREEVGRQRGESRPFTAQEEGEIAIRQAESLEPCSGRLPGNPQLGQIDDRLDGLASGRRRAAAPDPAAPSGGGGPSSRSTRPCSRHPASASRPRGADSPAAGRPAPPPRRAVAEQPPVFSVLYQ